MKMLLERDITQEHFAGCPWLTALQEHALIIPFLGVNCLIQIVVCAMDKLGMHSKFGHSYTRIY